jgi:ADP-ribosylglycohydrolase
LCFLEGNTFEECVRLAVSLGGDADTMGCMAGAMASCLYPIPEKHLKQAKYRLDNQLRSIANRFNIQYSEKQHN